jgi:hypothetical protein
MKHKRPIETKDIVRIKRGIPGKTGVVNRVDGESVNVFVTQNNPYGIGIWFNIREVKRIGKVR